MHNNLAASQPNTVKRMFEGYVLRDAGGAPPTYDYGAAAGVAASRQRKHRPIL